CSSALSLLSFIIVAIILTTSASSCPKDCRRPALGSAQPTTAVPCHSLGLLFQLPSPFFLACYCRRLPSSFLFQRCPAAPAIPAAFSLLFIGRDPHLLPADSALSFLLPPVLPDRLLLNCCHQPLPSPHLPQVSPW
ncbi:hypothetical protein B296_00051163, partial [Ensete ventricosum]